MKNGRIRGRKMADFGVEKSTIFGFGNGRIWGLKISDLENGRFWGLKNGHPQVYVYFHIYIIIFKTYCCNYVGGFLNTFARLLLNNCMIQFDAHENNNMYIIIPIC